MSAAYIVRCCAAILVVLVAASYARPGFVVPPARLSAALYAEWAHEPWVWLDHHTQNQELILELVHNYTELYNIPVGAVDIDSEWSTGINNFIFDTTKFPQPGEMIDTLHNNYSAKVILWITSMIDKDSSNYAEAMEKGYVIKGVMETLHWWHGDGNLLDYTNEEAVNWWHSQMDNVLKLGVDGWKCDGTDPFIMEEVVPIGKKGVVSYREYADLYYGDFYNYTNSAYGGNKLIMSRPVDSFDNILYLSFSPRSVVFSGWVGDQDPTFAGLKDALNNMIHSAKAGYVGFGSDIGGYRSGDHTKEVFTRWAQLGAFSSLMENGGEGEHRPWMFGEDTVTMYRYFAWSHSQLAPYLLSVGTAAYATPKGSIMVPFRGIDYTLGPNIFVAPIIENVTVRLDIEFPSGSNWVDWWNSSIVYNGGSTLDSYDCPLDKYPVFHKEGSILPMNIREKYTGIGEESWGSLYSSWMLVRPVSGICRKGRINSSSSQRLDAEGTGPGMELTVECDWTGDAPALEMRLSAHPAGKKGVMLVFRGARDVDNVEVRTAAEESAMVRDGHIVRGLDDMETQSLSGASWQRRAHHSDFRVFVADVSRGATVSLKNLRDT